MVTMTKSPFRSLADVLDKAADVIDANGHHKRWLYDQHQASGGTPKKSCRVCVYGALNVAISGEPIYSGVPEESALVEAAGEALRRHLGLRPIDLVAEEWNDTPGRTAEDVTTALRGTAAELRAGATT